MTRPTGRSASAPMRTRSSAARSVTDEEVAPVRGDDGDAGVAREAVAADHLEGGRPWRRRASPQGEPAEAEDRDDGERTQGAAPGVPAGQARDRERSHDQGAGREQRPRARERGGGDRGGGHGRPESSTTRTPTAPSISTSCP